MNSIDVRTEKVAHGTYIGYFRTVRMGGWKIVQKGGERQLFDTAEQAELAAWRAMRNFWQADVVGTENGHKGVLEAANAIFRLGKKAIPVEKRRR
jgi:hypothetical protein